jgi:hypothetical protein
MFRAGIVENEAYLQSSDCDPDQPGLDIEYSLPNLFELESLRLDTGVISCLALNDDVLFSTGEKLGFKRVVWPIEYVSIFIFC